MKNLTLLVMLSLAVVFTACRREKDEELDTETLSSSDNFLVESNINDELKEVDAAATSSGLGKTGPVITIDSASSPKKMTIDYGTGTLCADGKTRAGRLVVTWTGRYRETGTVITITADSFYQNGNKIAGTKSVKNEGRNTAGNLYYTITVSNVTLTRADGRTRTWNANRVREWIAGENTATWTDDVYLITGSSTGVNANGLAYSSDITTPLRVDLSCQHRLTAGVLTVTPQGKRTREVNYGDGTCDNIFTLTIGNRTFTVVN
jgi:hypothetical protein